MRTTMPDGTGGGRVDRNLGHNYTKTCVRRKRQL